MVVPLGRDELSERCIWGFDVGFLVRGRVSLGCVCAVEIAYFRESFGGLVGSARSEDATHSAEIESVRAPIALLKL